MVDMNGNPSEYEGRIILENKKMRDYLVWCLEVLKNMPSQKSHDGPCGYGDCDAGCADEYYFCKQMGEIEKFLNN